MEKKKNASCDDIYRMVEELSREDKRKRPSGIASRRAFEKAVRIHRHLKALEQEILEREGEGRVSMSLEPDSGRIVLSIRHDNIHCRRQAYLNARELSILRKNRKVADAFRRCSLSRRVA